MVVAVTKAKVGKSRRTKTVNHCLVYNTKEDKHERTTNETLCTAPGTSLGAALVSRYCLIPKNDKTFSVIRYRTLLASLTVVA